MGITKILMRIKLIAAIGAATVSGLHTTLIPIAAFTPFFSFASMYNEELTVKLGWLILIAVGIYLLSFITADVLMRLKNATCNVVGLYIVVGINLLDMITACCSAVDSFYAWKMINILWSTAILVAALLGTRGQQNRPSVPSVPKVNFLNIRRRF